MKHFEKYCKEPEKIENYEKAAADNFKDWEVHHRLETHNSDGERRLVDISYKELKALGMYYNRPSSELIFLTRSEHNTLHRIGKQLSEETRNKMREAKKGRYIGENNPMYGKKHSDEALRKMSEAHNGKHPSVETRKKLSEANKGKHWFNNGKINIRAKECPPGFVPGRLI